MKCGRKSKRGIGLLVVVGVLALLSVLAATFGMLMSVELASSRNETEYEMARQAALAGEESVINALQASGGIAATTSGVLPVFDPNPSDPFGGQFLYKRDGMKVYFAAYPQTATVNSTTVTPPWMSGLGPDAPMFNINAMGFASDLGDNCNPDIRYTSFDCSLVRLLTGRFNPVYNAVLNPNPGLTTATITQIDALRPGFPSMANANEEQRMAVLLSRQIIAWRHGPDGFPGTAGTEERRLGHLPRWNSKLGDTNVNAGVGYPAASNNQFDWGWSDALPSRLTMIFPPGLVPPYLAPYFGNYNYPPTAPWSWSYTEPGVWSSYLGGGNWGNDIGLPVPGLFYGKMAAGSSANSVVADINQPGWRDWTTWSNCLINVATGPCKGAMAQITANSTNTLTLGGIGLGANPHPGDAFCIFLRPASFVPGGYVGALCQRWGIPYPGTCTGPGTATTLVDTTAGRPNANGHYVRIVAGTGAPATIFPVISDDGTTITINPAINPPGWTTPPAAGTQYQILSGEGDLVPNAMYWPNQTPNQTLATETNVIDLLVDNNLLLDPANYGLTANQGTVTSPPPGPTDSFINDSTKAWKTNALAGFVVHIYAGSGRGQVRTIKSNTATQFTIYNQVTTQPAYWTSNDPLADSTGNITPPTTATYQPSQYRIEWPDNNLPSKFQPNNLQGDDRLYLSLGDLRDPVIVPALVQDLENFGFAPATAQTNAPQLADFLLPAFQQYLTVSTQSLQANQSLIGINDWAVDGVDNTASGIVDSPADATAATFQANQHRPAPYIQSMYQKLGLKDWTRPVTAPNGLLAYIQQAAQLLANIIDFADAGDVPTIVSNTDMGETGTGVTPFNVYGAKGLHVTQVMPSPDAIYSANNDGMEMTSDGQFPEPTPPPPFQTDGKAWDWVPGSVPALSCWKVMDTNQPTWTATFTFTGLMPGYYAMRLIGSNTTLTGLITMTCGTQTLYPSMTQPDPEVVTSDAGTSSGSNTADTLNDTSKNWPANSFVGDQLRIFAGTGAGQAVSIQSNTATTLTISGNWTIVPDNTSQYQIIQQTWYTGFVRTLPGANGPLACFQVSSTKTLTFQLQAANPTQFRGFALCAQYIQFTNISAHDIMLNGYTVTTDQGQIVWQPLGNYTEPSGGNPVDLRRIPGASTPNYDYSSSPPTTGVFPINYGTYVICMSEAAYEKQWSAHSGDSDYKSAKNGDGIWGDAPNEAYTIYPYGDLSTDAQAMALLLGAKGTSTAYKPSVTVTNPTGNLIAGGVVDALDGLGTTRPAIMDTSQLDTTYHNVLSCYSSIEKTMILHPTYDLTSSYWAPFQAASAPSTPSALCSAQNALVTAHHTSPVTSLNDPRIPADITFRSCLNRNYGQIWSGYPVPQYPTLATPADLVAQNRVFPIILNRPYATTGWLGLVPTSTSTAPWQTIGSNTNLPTVNGTLPNVTVQATPPTAPEQLLGTLMSNATVGGVYARFNINTAPIDTLKSVFSDADAALIVATRNTRFKGFPLSFPALASGGWANWDEFLNDPLFQSLIRGQATAGTVTTLTAEAFRNWPVSPATGSLANRVVLLTGGTGAGQAALIQSNTSNMLTISFNTAPNVGTTYQIIGNGFNYSGTATSGSTTTITDTTQNWTGSLANGVIILTGGTAAGQCALIQSNTNNTVTISFATAPDSTTTYQIGIGFFDDVASGISNADAGAGTYADGFPDSSNEKKEWFMRFSNLFDLGSTSNASSSSSSTASATSLSSTYGFTVAGLVYKDQPWDPTNVNNNAPLAAVRIEVEADLGTNPPSIVSFRYLGQ